VDVDVSVGVGLLPGSLAGTRVIAGLGALEDTGSFFFFMWQGLELSGEEDGSADGWGVPVGSKGIELADKGEPEEEGDGGEAAPATRLAIEGPGKK